VTTHDIVAERLVSSQQYNNTHACRPVDRHDVDSATNSLRCLQFDRGIY